MAATTFRALLLCICSCAAQSTESAEYQPGAGVGGEALATACKPGELASCACDGGSGEQVCREDGSGFDSCDCSDVAGPVSSCGDGQCDNSETCSSCPSDCECARCDKAPACEDVYVPPSSLAEVLDLNVLSLSPAKDPLGEFARMDTASLNEVVERSAKRRPIESGGETTTPFGEEFPSEEVDCGDAMLRIRVAQVGVVKRFAEIGGDRIYCVIAAESESGGEIRVLPTTPTLLNGEHYQYTLDAGLIWGQTEARAADGGIMLTMDCYEADDSSVLESIIDDVGSASTEVGGILGPDSYGWVFESAGAATPILSDIAATNKDDHVMNLSQIIPADMQLSLTNGAYWTVSQQGHNTLSDWQWDLRLEAWGCATNGGL